ncbi:hypothetical protein DXG01_003115 [Tephrocybe rancida]|nr:hypothetical protein DXG01_003115 [Tephrocybe rancida]
MLPFPHSTVTPFIALSLGLAIFAAADPITVSVPSTAPGHNVVQPNFLGISLELSFMDEYCAFVQTSIRALSLTIKLRAVGNDTSTIPPTVLNYLSAIRGRTGNSPLRLRVGGNSMDSSVYVPEMTTPMLQLTQSAANSNNQPVNYGPMLWEVMKKVADNVGGAEYLIGAAEQALGSTLDGFLLGNEPDLYTTHLQRPKIKNYTTDIYIDNNCNFGKYPFGVPYYTQHANAWQGPAMTLLQSNTSAPKLIMSEFNSASCGGIPTVSDTFAVGSLWTIDYALQMAAVGYSAAYLHTRERGISYNLFTPPDGPNGNPGDWVTNPPYYALVATAEALQNADGAGGVVVDLNIANSKTDKKATSAGYAVYDSKGVNVQQFVLFNYANISNFANPSAATATFTLPASAFTASKKNGITVKFLSSSTLLEKNDIAWGGQSLAGVGNGTFQDNNSAWVVPNQQIDCTNGCSVDVPPTAMAVVFAASNNSVVKTKNNKAWASSIASPVLAIFSALAAYALTML